MLTLHILHPVRVWWSEHSFPVLLSWKSKSESVEASDFDIPTLWPDLALVRKDVFEECVMDKVAV